MLAVALFVALAAQASPQPGAVVVPIRQSGLSGNEFMGLSLQVHQALAAGGVSLAMDPATALAKLGAKSEASEACKAPEGCSLALGRKLGAAVVIALDAAGSRKNCAMHLEAIAVADGAKLGELDLLSPRDSLKDADKASLNGFAVALAPKLSAMAPAPAKLPDPPPPTDLPREADLRPPPPPDAPKLEIAKPTPAPTGTRPAVIGTAVGAGVAAAAAVALGIVGAMQASELGSANPNFTWPGAQSRADQANQLYGSAGAAAGVAAVLATVAIVLQVSD
ncbi:MAG TPA: hypothetical protein VGK67_24945 [Myxococcales bacterium]|jgi:hypothetical protein